MNNEQIISKINGALHQTTVHMSWWLNKMLRQVTKDWWQECVIDKLSYNQRMIATEKNITTLEEFDLAALLRNLEYIGFCIGLILITRQLIKG